MVVLIGGLVGYTYCSSCSDNQALMPRTGSNETGYDPAAVCNYCIEYLTGRSFFPFLDEIAIN